MVDGYGFRDKRIYRLNITIESSLKNKVKSEKPVMNLEEKSHCENFCLYLFLSAALVDRQRDLLKKQTQRSRQIFLSATWFKYVAKIRTVIISCKKNGDFF